MQKHVNLVDLVKSSPTNIYLQNLASIQRRTSPVKFAHLAEESDNGSISNLSTRFRTALTASPARAFPPSPSVFAATWNSTRFVRSFSRMLAASPGRIATWAVYFSSYDSRRKGE